MVTHNPELAEQYATRIVNLADGVIRSDSDPYRPTAEDMRESEKPARRTRMVVSDGTRPCRSRTS